MLTESDLESYILTSIYNNILVLNSVLKHLKTLQRVSIIIQIIFRELVGSLLNSVTLTRNLRALWRWSEWWSKHVRGFL